MKARLARKDERMSNNCQLTQCEKNGELWITLPDSVNMDNYVSFEEQIDASLGSGLRTIVIDMGCTNNLFSSGLGLLIRLKKKVDALEGELYLVNVSKKLRETLAFVNLDRWFTLYDTDVEFEISQTDMMEKRQRDESCGFVFTACIESGVYRITMSGDCINSHDLTALSVATFDKTVKDYVCDLTGLDMVDSVGVKLLSHFFVTIRNDGGRIVTYGGDEFVRELFEVLGLTQLARSYLDEREAMEAIGKA